MVVPLTVVYPLLRLLPLRGVLSLGIAVFFLIPLYFLAWWGGLGIALVLVLTDDPRHPFRRGQRVTYP